MGTARLPVKGRPGRPPERDPLESDAAAYAYLRKQNSADEALRLVLFANRARDLASVGVGAVRSSRAAKKLLKVLSDLDECLCEIHPPLAVKPSDLGDEPEDRGLFSEEQDLWLRQLQTTAEDVRRFFEPESAAERVLLGCEARTRWLGQMYVATNVAPIPWQEWGWADGVRPEPQLRRSPTLVELMCLALLSRCSFMDATTPLSREKRLKDWGASQKSARAAVLRDDDPEAQEQQRTRFVWDADEAVRRFVDQRRMDPAWPIPVTEEQIWVDKAFPDTRATGRLIARTEQLELSIFPPSEAAKIRH